jgi:cobalamin biosynthesis protein CobD/CbiB
METGLYISTASIAAALALDLLAGDPSWMPHPVRFIGRAVTVGEARLRAGEPRADLCSERGWPSRLPRASPSGSGWRRRW